MEHATVPIPTDLEPAQAAMLKDLREGQPRVKFVPFALKTMRTFSAYGEFPAPDRQQERAGKVLREGCTPAIARFRYLQHR